MNAIKSLKKNLVPWMTKALINVLKNVENCINKSTNGLECKNYIHNIEMF